MALQEFSGSAIQVRLTGTLTAGELGSFTVDQSVNGFPTGATAPFVVTIDRGTASEEKILVTSRSGATFNGLTRGYDGTSALQHSAQAIVEHTIDAVVLTEINRHVNDDSRDDHSQYLKSSGVGIGAFLDIIANVAPTNSGPGDVAAIGDDAKVARADHVHGRENPLWTGHTFVMAGDVVVASGDLDFLNPIFIPVNTGRTCKLVKAKHKINAGTSATVKLQINGVDAAGFTGISVTTTAAETNPADIALADGDRVNLIVTAVSGVPRNLSFTIVLEHD